MSLKRPHATWEFMVRRVCLFLDGSLSLWDSPSGNFLQSFPDFHAFVGDSYACTFAKVLMEKDPFVPEGYVFSRNDLGEPKLEREAITYPFVVGNVIPEDTPNLIPLERKSIGPNRVSWEAVKPADTFAEAKAIADSQIAAAAVQGRNAKLEVNGTAIPMITPTNFAWDYGWKSVYDNPFDGAIPPTESTIEDPSLAPTCAYADSRSVKEVETVRVSQKLWKAPLTEQKQLAEARMLKEAQRKLRSIPICSVSGEPVSLAVRWAGEIGDVVLKCGCCG